MSETVMREAASHVAGQGDGDEGTALGELLLSPARVLTPMAEADGPGATVS